VSAKLTVVLVGASPCRSALVWRWAGPGVDCIKRRTGFQTDPHPPSRTLQEIGRLFCPRCGNATVEKVEVLTGPDGQEQYGVRRKHVLRGTRFSLPKPKVGC